MTSLLWKSIISGTWICEAENGTLVSDSVIRDLSLEPVTELGSHTAVDTVVEILVETSGETRRKNVCDIIIIIFVG